MLAAFLFPAGASGQVSTLDWDTVDWTATWNSVSGRTVSQTFDVDGVDVTISITRPVSGDFAGSTRPDDTSTPIARSSGQGLVVDAVFDELYTDTIEFSITFSETVYDVNFEIWDIDLGNFLVLFSRYQDIVSGFSGDPTLTAVGSGSDVNIDNTNNVLTGVASNGRNFFVLGSENDSQTSGDVRVDYGGTRLTSVSFQYSSGDDLGILPGSDFSPSLQRIALGDISFTVVPEPSTILVAALVSIFLPIAEWWRRRRPVHGSER